MVIIKFEIQKGEIYEAKDTQCWALLHWIKIGDKVPKWLFKRFKPIANYTQCFALLIDNRRITSLKDIYDAFSSHYHKVFSSHSLNDSR